MSDNGSASNRASAEQRAEELMQRVVSDGSRIVGKVVGRVREEVEDIVAEARERRARPPRPKRD